MGSTLAKFNKSLFDYIGNEYQRKNLYLLDVANLEEKIEEADKDTRQALKIELKELIKNKKEHPYNIKLNEFKQNEKKFLIDLKSKKKEFKNGLDKNMSSKLKNLQTRLFEGEQKHDFYKEYIDLSYDAELAYEESKLIKKHLPEIIKSLSKSQQELRQAMIDRGNIDLKEEQKAKEELAKFKIKQKNVLKEGIKDIKLKRRMGVISSKALKNGITELKLKYKKAVSLKAFEAPKKANQEMISSKKYEINKGTKRMLTVLNADIADVRRKTPMETQKSIPTFAFFTFMLPGLGQFLNKQYEKAGMFLLMSFFTYFIAIPYALGYGNFQGEGIAGLISLAQGGARVHRSLIFMIEGIIAVFLVIIALTLIYLSFNDVLKVEKDKIKGIRPKNFFETINTIKNEGFPFLITSPALIVTIFIVLVPVTTTILLSFTNMNPNHQSKFNWIGIENYRRLIMGQGLTGSVFWLILGWTIVWTLVSTTLAILIGFGLSLIANNDRIIGKKVFRAIYLLPWAVPAFITIMFFSIMFSPNGALTMFISNVFGGGERIVIKHSPNLTRLILILLQGWLGSAYVFLLSTGVLQSIPEDLYEAAEIDGATPWQKVRRITIPMVLFQTAPLLVGQYTFNFNNFSIIYLFNGGGPFNPSRYGNLAGSTDLLISYVYKLTMDNQHQAIGATVAIFISLGLMFFAFIGFKNSKAFKEERL